MIFPSYTNTETQGVRVCACGCGASLERKRTSARYASDACRTAAYKKREGIVGYRPVRAPGTVLNGRRGGPQVSPGRVLAELLAIGGKGGLIIATPSEIAAAVERVIPARQRRTLR